MILRACTTWMITTIPSSRKTPLNCARYHYACENAPVELARACMFLVDIGERQHGEGPPRVMGARTFSNVVCPLPVVTRTLMALHGVMHRISSELESEAFRRSESENFIGQDLCPTTVGTKSCHGVQHQPSKVAYRCVYYCVEAASSLLF